MAAQQRLINTSTVMLDHPRIILPVMDIAVVMVVDTEVEDEEEVECQERVHINSM